MGLSSSEDWVSGGTCRSGCAPVSRGPPTSALSLGPGLHRERPGCRASWSRSATPRSRVPRPAACHIGPGAGDNSDVPRCRTLGLGDVFFRQKAASLAVPKQRGRETDHLCLSDPGKQCSEMELLLPLLFSSFTWHVGCLRDCAELEGYLIEGPKGGLACRAQLPTPGHRRAGPGQFRIGEAVWLYSVLSG